MHHKIVALVCCMWLVNLASGTGCKPCPACDDPKCECGDGIKLEASAAASASMSAADYATSAFKESDKARLKAVEAIDAVQRLKFKFQVASEDCKYAYDKAQSVSYLCIGAVLNTRCPGNAVITILTKALAVARAAARAKAESTAIAHAFAEASAKASSGAQAAARAFAEAAACATASASSASNSASAASIYIDANCTDGYAVASAYANAAAEAQASAKTYAKVAVEAAAEVSTYASAVGRIFLDLGAKATVVAEAKAIAETEAAAAIAMFNKCKYYGHY